MIIDLILLSVIGAAFYGGFKVGNQFKTLTEAWVALKKKVAG
ncbi:hypothetical protein [Acidovorax sp. HMWF018]|nr:hypothetical protein [Acidovorax sp. HMWF018]